jgi:hypothetical protein
MVYQTLSDVTKTVLGLKHTALNSQTEKKEYLNSTLQIPPQESRGRGTN